MFPQPTPAGRPGRGKRTLLMAGVGTLAALTVAAWLAVQIDRVREAAARAD